MALSFALFVAAVQVRGRLASARNPGTLGVVWEKEI